MRQKNKILLTAASLLLMAGCSKPEETVGTVPSSVLLKAPEVDTENSVIRLRAVYNGDDKAVKDAEFTMTDIQGGESIPISGCRWSGGEAEGTVTGLALGKDYTFNFEIHTKGGNTVKAEKDMDFPYYKPDKVAFRTLTTLTAKVLSASYNGCDALIRKARFIIKNSKGQDFTDRFPEAVCSDRTASILFDMSLWEEDLYTCTLEMTFFDSQVFLSEEYRISLLPLPENITLNSPSIEDGKFIFSAGYDGEDKTITEAYFELYDKTGELLQSVPAKFADRSVSAGISGYPYGRYAFNCFLKLVDGTTISAPETIKFTYSKPRQYAYTELDPVELGKAGMATGSGVEGTQKVSLLDMDYEYENIYCRTSSGKTTLYCKSSLTGYMANTEPFQYGIKTVYINNSSGKDLVAFACYGKLNEEDEWTEITSASKEGYQFIYDFSGSDYNYFKFSTKAKAELKANSFAVDYYTEAPDEY